MTISSTSPLNVSNPKDTAQLISDPAASRAVADLKRRWPAIGAAADHPLTEFFIQRLERKNFRRRGIDAKYKRIAFVVMFFAFFFCLRFFPTVMQFYMRYNHLFLVAIFAAVALNRKYRKPPKQHNLKSPFQLLYEAGDVSQWEHLWLAPLSYRDLAGTCIGVVYHQRTTKKAWAFWLLAWLMVVAAFVMSFSPQVSRLVVAHNQSLLPWLAVGSSLLFVVIAALRLIRNPAHIVHLTMRRMQTLVIQRQQQFFIAHKLFWRRGCATMLLIFGIQFNVMMLIFLRHHKWQAIAVSLITWGIITLAVSRHYSKLDMSKRFEDFIARETPEFEQLVAQMIGR